MVRAISFDMACTLFYEPACSSGWYEGTLRRAIDRAYKLLVREGYSVDCDRLYNAYKEYCIKRQTGEKEIWHLLRWYYVLSRYGLTPKPGLVYRVYKAFVEAIVDAFTIPSEHVSLLKELREMGYIIILSTDTGSHDIPLGVLRKTGTIDYFDYVISSQLVGYTKKSIEFYRTLLEVTKLEPSELIHIGDSYERDYVCPRRIGIKSILYTGFRVDGNVGRGDVLSISDLSRIADFL